MSAAEERWDVVVVGLHDPSPEASRSLASQLGSLCGMAPAAIQAALDDGEVPVHAGLRRHEAERAASDLDRLGAAVDLRLSASDGGAYPIFKPDARRQSGTAVGGFIDDSATPPRFADSGVHDVPLEPDPEGGSGPPVALVGPPDSRHTGPSSPPAPPVVTRKRTVGAEPMAPLPPPPAHNAYAAPPVPGFGSIAPPPAVGGAVGGAAAGGSPDALTALSSELDKLATGDADALLGTIDGSEPIKGKPDGPARPREFDRVSSRPSAAQRQAARDARARAKAESDSSDAVPTKAAAPEPALEPEPPPPARAKKAKPEAEAEPAAPPPKKKKKKKKGKTGELPAASAPAKLELDFEKAGLSESHVGGVLAAESQAAAAPPGLSPPRAGTGVHARVSEFDGEAQPLLGPDRITSMLFGAAIGLGVSLVLTVFLHKGIEQDAILGLETELQESMVNPGKVVSGELRATGVIEGELDGEYDDIRRSFLLKWLLIGAPIGFVLGHLNRFR